VSKRTIIAFSSSFKPPSLYLTPKRKRDFLPANLHTLLCKPNLNEPNIITDVSLTF